MSEPRTRHGLNATALNSLWRAKAILATFDGPIRDAIAGNFDAPSSLSEVMDGIKTLLDAELIDPEAKP
jgi:hypothetical protein